MSSYTARPGPVPGTSLWRVAAEGDANEAFRVLPDAAMDVVCFRGELLFAGPDTTAMLVPSFKDAATWGLRFSPGLAPSLLGVSADDVVNQRIALHELLRVPPAALDAAYFDPAEALELVAVELWQRVAPDPAVLNLACSLDSSARKGASVQYMSEHFGLSQRTLLRFSSRVFGYGLKTLMAIHRFQRALDLSRTGAAIRDVAAGARYADQAHLSREARRFSGVTFRHLIDGASQTTNR
ncbi:helix-turn-helix domain-containing protein [Nesterenkonia haasae]|uniref:helix-turn-helix domain-containing protein n=1 Tax=Nesterenkonia haasae TaxID=2587813 RepID=UPI001391E8FB|nr:helix-turn-helix domain-containing protein [Nesterenkonia haasae]NDK31513.1 AraC family transcriptional regulator [Nesterenkonia haasae]